MCGYEGPAVISSVERVPQIRRETALALEWEWFGSNAVAIYPAMEGEMG